MIQSLILVNRISETILFSRYYDNSSIYSQRVWERHLRILTYDDWSNVTDNQELVVTEGARLVVYSGLGDVVCFIAGTEEHNELVLVEVARAILEVLRQVCGSKVTSASVEASKVDMALYFDEMISPSGDLQRLDKTDLKRMVKMKLSSS